MKVMGVVGWKNNGKTTLVERLIKRLIMLDVNVSTIKHTHHLIETDSPGTDSWRHKQAGAGETLLATSHFWTKYHRVSPPQEPCLASLLSHLSPCDIVLVEGFKRAAIPKIEVSLSKTDTELLALEDKHIIAVAADHNLKIPLPLLPIDDIKQIAGFVLDHAKEFHAERSSATPS